MRTPELRSLAIVMAATAALAIPFADVPLAQAIHGSAFVDDPTLQGGTLLLDWITGKEIWRFLLAALLLVPGLALMATPVRRKLGAMLVFVGGVHGLASLVVVLAKPIVGRMRPTELIVAQADSMWFVGGSSFPSGHTAFYFGLFLPIAWLFPRHHLPLMFVPVFIALARINANDHYLADVCTSVVLCCLLTLAFARLLRPWLPADEPAR